MSTTITDKINNFIGESSDFDTAFSKWLTGAQKIVTDYMSKEFPGQIKTLQAQKGKKFIKIVAIDSGLGAGKSAWAFVDTTNGDVLKPAGWAAPAKGARGNIFDKDGGLGSISAYGPAYKRGMSF